MIWLNYTVNSATASADTVRWTCTSLIQIPRVGPCNHSSVFCLIMTLWGEHLQTYTYYSAGLTDQTVSILERFAGFDLVLMHRSVKVQNYVNLSIPLNTILLIKACMVISCTKRKTSVNLTHRTRLLVQVKQKNNCTHLNQSR